MNKRLLGVKNIVSYVFGWIFVALGLFLALGVYGVIDDPEIENDISAIISGAIWAIGFVVLGAFLIRKHIYGYGWGAVAVFTLGTDAQRLLQGLSQNKILPTFIILGVLTIVFAGLFVYSNIKRKKAQMDDAE